MVDPTDTVALMEEINLVKKYLTIAEKLGLVSVICFSAFMAWKWPSNSMEELFLYVGITLNFCFILFIQKSRQVLFWATCFFLAVVNVGIVVKIATSTRDFNYAHLTPYFILLFGACIQASSRGLDWINNYSDVQLRLDQEEEIRRAVRHWNQDRKRVALIVTEYGYFPDRELRTIIYEHNPKTQEERDEIIENYLSRMEKALSV